MAVLEMAACPDVAPLAGAWIETGANTRCRAKRRSRPLRARGLKLGELQNAVAEEAKVAPLAGAWIETTTMSAETGHRQVAPLAGAWIET